MIYIVDKILKSKFDRGAKKYDRQRHQIIPNLDQMYDMMTELASSDFSRPKILDLGAGTGLLTNYIFKKYSQGHFTLLDISKEMLNIARERFKGNPNFKFINEDYLESDFVEKYDIIISSLSIHHLKNHSKRKIYSKMYESLNKGGIFLNLDQIYAPSAENENIYQRNWLEKIESKSLPQSEKEIIFDRMKHDRPATLENNLKWLKNCGFINVDVFYKYYNFCILYGKK
jgi:tRNA (cmo5U34)-methyltransferase